MESYEAIELKALQKADKISQCKESPSLKLIVYDASVKWFRRGILWLISRAAKGLLSGIIVVFNLTECVTGILGYVKNYQSSIFGNFLAGYIVEEKAKIFRWAYIFEFENYKPKLNLPFSESLPHAFSEVKV